MIDPYLKLISLRMLGRPVRDCYFVQLSSASQ
jgi:hypothetical protein